MKQENLRLRFYDLDKIEDSNKGEIKHKIGRDVRSEIRLAPFICYEIIFPKPFAKDNAVDADILLNVTNDAWFGKSIGPYQHLAMARMRAVEYGKPVIRAANSGISAYIDKFGRVIQKIELNKDGFFDIEY